MKIIINYCNCLIYIEAGNKITKISMNALWILMQSSIIDIQNTAFAWILNFYYHNYIPSNNVSSKDKLYINFCINIYYRISFMNKSGKWVSCFYGFYCLCMSFFMGCNATSTSLQSIHDYSQPYICIKKNIN